MTSASEWITTTRTENRLEMRLTGDWTIDNVATIDVGIAALASVPDGPTIIDVSPIGRMDTSGAWMLEKMRRRFSTSDNTPEIHGLQPNHQLLLDRLHSLTGDPAPEPARHSALSLVAEHTGRATIDAVREAIDLLNFLGLTTVTAARTAISPRRFRMTAFVYHLE